MYTRCTQCNTAFRIEPEDLSMAAGEVRCGRCGSTFNALLNLSNQPPDGSAGDASDAAADRARSAVLHDEATGEFDLARAALVDPDAVPQPLTSTDEPDDSAGAEDPGADDGEKAPAADDAPGDTVSGTDDTAAGPTANEEPEAASADDPEETPAQDEAPIVIDGEERDETIDALVLDDPVNVSDAGDTAAAPTQDENGAVAKTDAADPEPEPEGAPSAADSTQATAQAVSEDDRGTTDTDDAIAGTESEDGSPPAAKDEAGAEPAQDDDREAADRDDDAAEPAPDDDREATDRDDAAAEPVSDDDREATDRDDAAAEPVSDDDREATDRDDAAAEPVSDDDREATDRDDAAAEPVSDDESGTSANETEEGSAGHHDDIEAEPAPDDAGVTPTAQEQSGDPSPDDVQDAPGEDEEKADTADPEGVVADGVPVVETDATDENESNPQVTEDDSGEELAGDTGPEVAATVAAAGADEAIFRNNDAFDEHDARDLSAYLTPPANKGRLVILGLASLVLAALLLSQLVHHFRAQLATHPVLGEHVASLYDSLGIRLIPDWDAGTFNVEGTADIVQFSTIGEDGEPIDALRVSAIIVNNATGARPAPVVKLRLQNRWGETVAARDFTPDDYRGGTTTLAAGEKLRLQLQLLDPGKDVVGFDIDLCLPGANGLLRCATDAGG